MPVEENVLITSEEEEEEEESDASDEEAEEEEEEEEIEASNEETGSWRQALSSSMHGLGRLLLRGTADEQRSRDDEQREQQQQQQQQQLRKELLRIRNDPALSEAQKAKRSQDLLLSSSSSLLSSSSSLLSSSSSSSSSGAALPLTPVLPVTATPPTKVTATWHDPTSADRSEALLVVTYQSPGLHGCSHYLQKCRIFAPCCRRWFTCRQCHDAETDHALDRYSVDTIVCMLCATIQPCARRCVSCATEFANYYCDICHLWEDKDRDIYHCPDCRICRVGKGIGIDQHHCKKCNACIAISLVERHRCIENILDGGCPVCLEEMFTSTKQIVFMRCGHAMHRACLGSIMEHGWQCPICQKTVAEVSDFFQRIDAMLSETVMPEPQDKRVSLIYCYDCEQRSEAKFHWIYHKCAHCSSYSTVVTSFKDP